MEQMCFDTDTLCLVKDCNKSVVQHERAFIHGTTGRINVSVEKVAYEVNWSLPHLEPPSIFESGPVNETYRKVWQTWIQLWFVSERTGLQEEFKPLVPELAGQ